MRTASKSRRPGYMAALVVGTALTTLASAPEAKAVDDLTRYCNACWRNARVQPDDWSDCTQEVFARLLERVETSRWHHILTREAEERKEFLRAIDAVKKRTQRAHRPASLAGDVADRRDDRRLEARQSLLAVAHRELPPRQAEIIQLSLDGWSVAEIADHLRIRPMRVSDEKYKAIRRLQEAIL